MASTYKTIVLASRPKGDIVPWEQFKIVEQPVPSESELQEDHALVENLYLSLDPAMRGWMNDTRSYVPPVQINEVMRGYTIGRVLASRASSFKRGDFVAVRPGGWAELAVVPSKSLSPISSSLLSAPGARLTDAMGPLGGTGMTAYFGLFDIGQPKAGETVVVSGAAGATGSMVCQFAKITGCRVVGIAGGKEKCSWLKDECGVDEVVDYKEQGWQKRLKQVTPDFIDIFFDNVGGEILEAALTRAKPHARFVMCGSISTYNDAEAKGTKNLMMIIAMRIRMQGFIVFDYADRYGEAQKAITEWLTSGRLKRKEHIVKGGLEKAPEALTGLFKGINTGKMMVEIKSENESPRESRL